MVFLLLWFFDSKKTAFDYQLESAHVSSEKSNVGLREAGQRLSQ